MFLQQTDIVLRATLVELSRCTTTKVTTITVVICTACTVAIYARGGLESAAFSPFFYDWRGMQEDGFLDPKELRANRFNII